MVWFMVWQSATEADTVTHITRLEIWTWVWYGMAERHEADTVTHITRLEIWTWVWYGMVMYGMVWQSATRQTPSHTSPGSRSGPGP